MSKDMTIALPHVAVGFIFRSAELYCFSLCYRISLARNKMMMLLLRLPRFASVRVILIGSGGLDYDCTAGKCLES